MRSSTNQKVQIRLTLSGKEEKKTIPGLRSAYGSQCRQKFNKAEEQQEEEQEEDYIKAGVLS